MAERISRLLSIAEAAAELHISQYTVRAWKRLGRLGYVKLGSRTLIPREEVERIIREGFTPARKAVEEWVPGLLARRAARGGQRPPGGRPRLG